LVILLAVFALAIGILAPVAAAGAQVAESESPPAVEKSASGSYIVVMAAEPLLADFDQDELTTPAAEAEGVDIKKSQDEVLESVGASPDDKINEYTNALNGFSAVLSHDEAVALAEQKSVSLVMVDELQQPDTDSSPAYLDLTGPAGPWQTGFDGGGVVVGVIDSGIWPEHPSFADDGSYAAPKTPPLDDSRPNCEFGNTAHNAGDAPFECNNKLIGARQMLDTYRALIGAAPDEYDSARDDNGHGTHTASTTAGNADVAASMYGEPLPSVSGIAPRAHVIAYKGLGNLGGFTSDLASAIDQAVADGVDVINYSIGDGADEPSPDEIAFLFAADAGVFVATSAGNSGPGPSTVGNPGTMPWITTVGASTQSRFYQGTVVLGDGTEFNGASITLETGATGLVDAEFAGGDLCIPGTLDSGQVSGKIVLCRRGAIARAAKSLAVFQAGGVGTILYNNSDVDDLFTDTHWTSTVHMDNTPGLAIKAYIGSAGGLATAAIADTRVITEWPSAPSMTIFSSRGPNASAPDIIKPDITGPGLQILAGYSPTPNPGSTPSGELFGAIAGTSMSSPHIAGVFALLKQAHPDWSAATARSAIMTTAHQDVVDNDRTSPADPFDMGAGHVDPGNKVRKGSAFQPGLAYDAGLFEYAAFTCGMDWGVFSSGSCDFLENIGVPSDPSDLNYPSIGIADLAGSQTVTRTVTSVAQENGWRTYKVNVDAPEGYEVTVEPSRFRLKSGQTATYDVTITNVSAPSGEWRHGSLTWTDRTDHYAVYSPISVKGALFSAPPQVAGAGETGNASFDVSFGYTGSSTAAPHGLDPAVVTSDNVLQDPDQSFDPNDGFSNPHSFTLNGSAFFRIAIPPEATERNADLDIYVEDPTGAFVAQSTAGGTNELVDLTDPMDGTWTVWVHGWLTPGGDSDYDMYTWDISQTPGGNLTIDSAPTSATIGATETIDVSWSGAAAGSWHLGAVSHTGDVGLMGLTLVEVDNR
jgi:subtilisin family serine protease